MKRWASVEWGGGVRERQRDGDGLESILGTQSKRIRRGLG